MIIDRLKGLFRGDAVVAPGAVFPAIDADRIALDLRLVERGRENGAAEMPRTDDAGLDAVEAQVVARVAEARRAGLDNYAANRDVHARRLSRASSASMEVRAVAGSAQGDFELEVKAFRGRMTATVKDLKEWSAALAEFRRRHRLARPAYSSGNLPAALTILILGVAVETVLNGYLFAQRNTLGLLGGGLVALLVSVVNVAVATLGGLSTRFIRHANPVFALAGIAFFAAWAAFLVGFNLAVAHFRDAVESLAAWGEAATRSLDTLLANPFGLDSIESWLLMLVGCLIGLLAFLKFVPYGEPYPGYGRIARRFEQALDDYADQLVRALDSLEDKRDEAVDALQEANEVVRENIGDAIDALYGHRMMRGQLAGFLEGCDGAATGLLRLYRDANRAARSTPAPARFDEAFRFPPHPDPEMDLGHREDASRELREIGRIVDEAVTAIQADYRRLKHDYPDPDALIGLDMGTARPATPPDAPVPLRAVPIEAARRP